MTISGIKRFLQFPTRKKVRYLVLYLRDKCIPFLPLPVRTLDNSLMLCFKDDMGTSLFMHDDFERGEQVFVSRYIDAGIVFFDIGAHNGLYTVMASRKVGSSGSVVAFEPSPREFHRLKLNVSLNRCGNVTIEPVALGSTRGDVNLYVNIGKRVSTAFARPRFPILWRK